MRWLLLFFASLIPQLVWGQNYTGPEGGFANATSGFTLVPPPTDLSISYLSDIFGLVDGVLHGTGSQILGNMFGVFNAFILTIAGVVITYILFVSTLNTAHDGKVLGQKWSSIWIPIRAVVGIGALVPKASGYCFIQIFLMWIVVQGVGAADSIWYAALNYLSRGGVLIQHAQFKISQNTPETQPILIFSAGGVLKSETCMYTLRNALLNLPPAPGQPTVPDFNTSLVVTGQPSNLSPPCYKGDTRPGCPAGGDGGGMILFPGNVSYGATPLQGVCGNISWNFIKNAQGEVDIGGAINYANLGAYDARSVAAQQIVLSLQSLAYTLSQILLPIGPGQVGRNLAYGDTPINGLINPGRDYIAIIRPALNVQGQEAARKVQTTLDRAAMNGWILAGSYYFTLASLNRAFTATEQNPPVASYPQTYDPNIFRGAATILNANLTNATINSCSPMPTNLVDNFICGEYSRATTLSEKGFVPSFVVPPPQPGQAGITGTVPWWQKTISSAGASFTEPGAGWTGFRPQIPTIPKTGGMAGAVKSVINKIPEAINAVLDEMTKNIRALFAAQVNNIDPLIGISNLGNQILTWAEWIWLGGSVGIFFAAALASCSSVNPAGWMLGSMLTWFVPMMSGIMFAMFLSGMMMAYYIPLIPMIIFTFTAIGWFVAVIESMVAGPLVALGLISPEGHEYFGQAQNSIMLMLNLFVRPSLIIFGFIAAAILAHVGLWLFNTALGTAMTTEAIQKSAYTPFTSGILATISIMLVYTTVVLSIVNRSFALIHEIPSNVLTWIGGNIRQFGEAEGAKGIEGEVSGKFGTAKGGAESVVSGTHGTAKTAYEMGMKKGKAKAGAKVKPS